MIEPSNSFATHRDPAAARERVRAFPDRDRRLLASGGGLEAGDGSVDVVRDPDRAERGEHRGRSVPTACVSVTLRSRVDARHARGRDRDPHAVGREGHAGGLPGERHRSDRPPTRIDPEERGADRVGHPQRAVADRDPRRPCAGAGGSVSSLVSGSIRLTVPSPAFVTQTEPSPIAMPEGDGPTGIVS